MLEFCTISISAVERNAHPQQNSRETSRVSSAFNSCCDWCTCSSFSVVCLIVGSSSDLIPVASGSAGREAAMSESSGVGETVSSPALKFDSGIAVGKDIAGS